MRTGVNIGPHRAGDARRRRSIASGSGSDYLLQQAVLVVRRLLLIALLAFGAGLPVQLLAFPSHASAQTGTINIVKNTVGGDGTFNFSGGLGSFGLTTTGGAAQRSFDVAAGTYAVTEAATAGFDLTGIMCIDPSGGTTTGGATATIGLLAGETVTCTYTNTAQGTINIIKNTVGGDGTFNFSGGLGAFALATTGGTAQRSFLRTPGTYAVTEAATAGFDLAGIVCIDPSGGTTTGGATATIGLAAGETVNCTYTNPARGTINIIKNTVGGDGTFNFSGGLGAFALTTVGGTVQQSFNVAPGTYAVTEAATAGFGLTGLVCTDPSGGTTTGGATATVGLGAGETVTCTFTNTVQGEITIIKNTVGGDGSFNFTGDLGSFSLATSGGTAQQSFDVVPGTYTVTEVLADAAAAGFHLTDLQCSDPSGGTTTSGATATIALAAGETVICTYTDRNVREETLDRIRTFLHRRADLLLESEPDRRRRLNRLSGPEGGAGFAAVRPFDLTAKGNETDHAFDFAISLSQFAGSAAAAKQRRLRQAMGAVLALEKSGTPAPAAPTQSRFDVWVEGHYTGFDDDTGGDDRDGHLGVFYVGTDVLISPTLLVGMMAQYDWAEDNATALGSNVDGEGWMVGPYVSGKIFENVTFHARGAWGQSENDIELVGLTQDDFDTNRWLASGSLMGTWRRGNLQIVPTATVKYIQEDQDSFVNTLGIVIPSQRITLGRLSFGPEISYSHQRARGTVFEPYASLTGLWDFDDAGSLTTIGGAVVGTDDLRAKAAGGLTVRRPDGISLQAAGTYDGIGDGDFSGYGVQLKVSVPLN